MFAARAPVAAVPITALAALFAVQAGRVRFTFDDEAFELKTTSTDSEELKDSGENIVVGGANRWITFPCQLHQCLRMGWKDCVMDSEIPQTGGCTTVGLTCVHRTEADDCKNKIRWKYDTWVHYDFFPSKDFPILVYFKETQTPEEKWGEGPGGLDKVGGGQVHFFPAICNVEELDKMFKEKNLPSARYNPK